MFSSKSFIVFALTFCSFIYVDFLNMAWGSGPTLFLFFFFCHTVCWFFVPKPGIKARAPAVRALSPNHRTSREVPQLYSSACGYPVVPAPFTEKILLPPLNGLGTLMLLNGYSTKHSITWKYLTLFIWSLYIWTFQFSSVAQSCLTLWDPMNHSTPGLPVHHQLLESTQTHVHWVGDAIHPSHPLSSPSPPALNPSQHQSLFKWVSSSHQVAKVLEFQLQHQSFQWTPRTDLL